MSPFNQLIGCDWIVVLYKLIDRSIDRSIRDSPVLANDDGTLEELSGEDGADGNVEDLVTAHGCNDLGL